MRARALGLLLVCASCGGQVAVPSMPRLDGPVKARSTPDADFRGAVPEPGAHGASSSPLIVERRLKNGVRVLFVERHDVPLMSVYVVSDRGADQADPGIPQVWTRTVMKASEERKWWDVSESWNDLGAEWSASATPDASTLRVQVLSKLAEPAMELFGDLVSKPVFGAKSIELARQRLRAELVLEYSRAGGQLRLAMARQFYPVGHPYREPWAPVGSLDKVQASVLEAYHRYAFTPAHVTIAVAGDITEGKLMPLLERTFGGLTGPTVGPQAPPAAPAEVAEDPRFIVIDLPQEAQGHVVFAWLGPERYHDGFVPLALAIGEIDYALFKKLRQEKGLTYGVHARANLGRARRLITFETSLETPHVGTAVGEVFSVLASRAKTPIGAAALDDLKATVTNDDGRFEQVASTTPSLALLATYGRPLDWFATMETRVAAVTAEEIRAAVERSLPLAGMRVFVAGDAATIAPQLTALGRGMVQVRQPKSL